jgi:HlyD family type I secretion membrane fusion protein
MSVSKVKTKASGHIGFGLFLLVFLLVFLGGWLAFAKLQGAVIAPGQVILSRNTVHVSHLDGGEVDTLLFKLGDEVQAGEDLVRLGTGRLQVDLLERELVLISAVGARLSAELRSAEKIEFDLSLEAEAGDLAAVLEEQNTIFAIGLANHKATMDRLQNELESLDARDENLAAQIKLFEEQMTLLSKSQECMSSLEGKGFATQRQMEEEQVRVLSIRQQVAELRLERQNSETRRWEIPIEIRGRDELRKKQAADELEERQLRAIALEKSLRLEKEKARASIIKAPENGIIIDMIPLAKGRVISPGEVVARILPSDGRFLIEGRIRPQDRDQLTIGQLAELRVAATNRSDVPTFMGNIEDISADRLIDEVTGEPYFRVQVGGMKQKESSTGNAEDDWFISTLRDIGNFVGFETLQKKTETAKIEPFDLQTGMSVDMFIQTKSRRAINYFMKPLTDALSRSFR